MIVKINGSAFDMARVMRFAPHKKDGLDFRPEDVCTLAELEHRSAVSWNTCRNEKSR